MTQKMSRRAYVQRDELPEWFDVPDDVADKDVENWVHEHISGYYETVYIEVKTED